VSSDTTRENLTLSDADLTACRPLTGEGGHVLRALCPFHGSDHQRSLRVTLASGRFGCFACGAWGYLAEARERWQAERPRQAAFQRPAARLQQAPGQRQAAAAAASKPAPRPPAPARPELTQQLAAFQAALPGSRGAAYLEQRGIPLALAQQLGVGYAAPGTWPHKGRDWQGGRVVFPHTTPDGGVVNLYGRAVGTAEQVPKAKRHDHLPGEKGYFNAAALQVGAGPLWVCEGVFDALALLAAGVPRVVAIFGVQGWRWGWARNVRELVFALDADAAETLLRRRLEALPADRWAYVVVDCPPTLGLLTVNALAAVQEVLVPVEAHVMALQGLAQLLQTVDVVKARLNPALAVAGILACRVHARTRHAQEVVEELRRRFGALVYQVVIRDNVRLAECPSFGCPITHYDPRSTGAADYRALAAEVLQRQGDVHHAQAPHDRHQSPRRRRP